MDINYLLSITSLYLKKEGSNKTYLKIIKDKDKMVRFEFNMNNNEYDATTFSLPFDLIMNRENIKMFLDTYKDNLLIIDESGNNENTKENYVITFNNGRILEFKNFNMKEMNEFRNFLYNIELTNENIKFVFDEKPLLVNNNYVLQESGYVSYKMFILIALIILIILVVALFAFKIIS